MTGVAGDRGACHALDMGSDFALAAALAAFAVQSAPTNPAATAQTGFSIPLSADRCIAMQSFHHNGRTVRLGLEARPATDNYALLIEGPGDIGRKAWVHGKIRIAGAKPEKDYSVIEPSSRSGAIIYMSRLKRAELEAGGANAKIEIQAGPNSLELIAFGLAPAIEQLDGCSSQLLEKWGYSQAFQRGVAAYPRPERELHTYASSDDYPASAVRRGAMGETHALVSVTDKGRASDCRIIRSSGHADLDTASCNIIVKRVRFVTGRATDGTPLAAPVYLTMKWELPR